MHRFHGIRFLHPKPGVTCESYTDTQRFGICLRTPSGEQTIGYAIGIVGGELSMTMFLLALFIIPLVKVYKLNLGLLNEAQQANRKKLKSLLQWSVIMAFINLATTNYMILSFVFTKNHDPPSAIFSAFDPVVNVLTSWLMIDTRRRRLAKLTCSCCVKSSGGETRLDSASTFIGRKKRRFSSFVSFRSEKIYMANESKPDASIQGAPEVSLPSIKMSEVSLPSIQLPSTTELHSQTSPERNLSDPVSLTSIRN